MSTADKARHWLHEAFKSTVEYVTPPLTVSAFREKGVLTPEEFVIAGDNLVHKCPTWAWEGGDENKRRKYLPADKQYLITRNVPCLRRVGALESDGVTGVAEVVEVEDEDGGWLATHALPSGTRGEAAEAIPSMEPGDGPSSSSRQGAPGGAAAVADDDDEDIPDISDFDNDDNMEADAATLETTYIVAEEPDNDDILKTRTYDVSITYDQFYQTPRIWLLGYDENRQLLPSEAMLEDVSQDHVQKTVTIDDHPHLSGKFASVHPCRHSNVMRKIVEILASGGGEPRVDHYLFIFLKFVQSLIPTIEYDYTLDADLGRGGGMAS